MQQRKVGMCIVCAFVRSRQKGVVTATARCDPHNNMTDKAKQELEDAQNLVKSLRAEVEQKEHIAAIAVNKNHDP